MPVAFHYQAPSFTIKNKKRITNWILLIAFLEKKQIEKLDFIFCSDDYLLKLNKEYLSHNTYTDIITFDYSETKNVIAEIYVSLDRVMENAASFKVSFEKELHRVMIHGILHCFGYRDKNDHERKTIRRKEEECLSVLDEMDN